MLSRHSPFITSSNPIWILALLLNASCGNLASSGSTTSASSSGGQKACSGDGGLFPIPIAPQSTATLKKFDISPSSVIIPAGTPLVAIVNEYCVIAQAEGGSELTKALSERVLEQRSRLSSRAYSLIPSASYSRSQLEALAFQDPCLVHLSQGGDVFRSATVNDSLFPQQTHLSAIEAPEGWDTLHSGLTGNVVIAVIDDGIQVNHPDLSGVLWTNPGEVAGNGLDDDNNGYVDDVNGYNFASNIGSPAHEAGSSHGTHVAGLAAAQGNNTLGITGVMGRNARIMALNVFGANPSATSAAIVNAINYARVMGAKVINMSLGGQGSASSVNTALINAVAGGAFIAIAAGNDNALVSASNFYQPMGYAKDIEGAISVGSTDATSYEKSSFSNYSTTYVEMSAPGSDAATNGVLSTYISSGYTYLQGTSMASPVLAGSAALLIGWVQSRGGQITPAQVETTLKASANSRSGLSSYFAGGAALNLKNLAATAVCNF